MDHSQGPPSRTAVPQHQQWSAGPALDDMSQRLISGALRKVAWIGAVGGRVLRRRHPVLSRAERACRPEAAAAGICLQRHPLLRDDRWSERWSGVLPIRLEVVPGRYQRDGARERIPHQRDVSPAGGGANSVTLRGTQPGNADTLFAWVEGGMGGCGGDTFGTVSFTPGSPVSLGLSLVAKSPCRYQLNLPKAEVDAGFALQS